MNASLKMINVLSYLHQMADEIAPIMDPKITRHCEFDTFVTRVDKRMKHASGLAIHKNSENKSSNSSRRKPQNQLHKSKYYLQHEQELKNRNIPNPNAERNKQAKKEIAQELQSRLRQYQKRETRGEFSLVFNCHTIDIPPDTREMAFFRYCVAMRNEQQPMYS